jgi:predicted unusual protein kinase regulating ubiquinone biosynthesis (AarF/ABC1/UbiB family)
MSSLAEKIYFLSSTFCIFLFELAFSLFHQSQQKFIQRLALQLSKKNILYVKLFQAVALNKNLINDEINNELMKFTDSAPYDENDIDRELLFKVKDEFNLDLCSCKPLNSGMISLVFKMHNNDTNEDVVLKVKRKNIDNILSSAIENVQFFVHIMSFIPYLNTFDIATTFNKNIDSLKQQLDFNQEVENMREVDEKCKNLNYIKIPRAYEEVTKKFPNVIMMEFIEGKTIQEIDEEDYSEYAGQLLKYGMASFLIHRVSHGDLHAGNILFLKDDVTQERKICLIDFGVILRIEQKISEDFLNIGLRLFTSPAREISRDLMCMYLEPVDILLNLPNNHFERIIDKLESIIEETIHSKNQADQNKLYQCIVEINCYINNNNLSCYGLKFNDSFVKTQMALAMCNGINMVLCKNDYMSFANKTINELFHTDLLKDN